MVVGEEGVGKTSLCACLRNKTLSSSKENVATDGISIDTAPMSVIVDGVKKDVDLSLWDFAGQGALLLLLLLSDLHRYITIEIYYATHQFFMSSRCIYVVVWNLTKDPDSSKIDFWLQSIKARAKSAHVFIVGTHLDAPKMTVEGAAYLLRKLETKYACNCHHRYFIINLFIFSIVAFIGASLQGSKLHQ
jgi:GTPase SAR1 family protein